MQLGGFFFLHVQAVELRFAENSENSQATQRFPVQPARLAC